MDATSWPMSELTLQAARRIGPKRIALALAGIWTLFALAGLVVELGHGGWALRAFDLADSDLERRLSLPASFTALLLLFAGAMAFALAGVDRSRRRRTWQLAGLAFVTFGLEKLVGLHSWLDERGVSWFISYLPLLALGSAALYRTIRVFRSQTLVQIVFAGSVALWIVAGVLDNPDLLGSSAAAQIVGMAAAALFALCLVERLCYLARQYYPLEERDTRLSVDQILAEALDRVKLQPLAVGLVLLTGALAVQEVLLQTGDYHPGLLTFILSMGLLALTQIFGPKPWVVTFGHPPMAVVYIPWLLALPLVGGIGAFLSRRAGGSWQAVISSTTFPVLPFLAAMLIVLLVSLIFDHVIAHNIAPMAIFMAFLGLVIAPGVALLAGGLPAQLFFSRRIDSRRTANG